MTSEWRMAFRNLLRNRRRNAATGAAIALGFAAMLAIGGYINRVEKYLQIYTIFGQRTGHIVIYKKNGFENFYVKPKQFSLTVEDQAAIREVAATMPSVELHGGILQGQGLVGNGCRTFPFLSMGIDPLLDSKLRNHHLVERWTKQFKNYSKGRGISEYPPELGAVSIAEGLARILHKKNVYDDLPADHKPHMIADCTANDLFEQTSKDANVQLAAGTWDGMMSALDGEIVSTFNTGVTETNSSAIVTDLFHLQKLYDTQNVSSYSLWLVENTNLKNAALTVTNRLKAKGVDVDVYTWLNEDLAPFYNGTMSFLRTMVGFVTFILATVVILSIFNAATMTVIERSQEIGMMRSLGFTRAQIKQLFVREIIALTFFSLIAGGILAIAGIEFINQLKITFTPPGVASAIQLLLDPNMATILSVILLVPVLSIGTTIVAIRNLVNKPITYLLMGSNR